MDRIESVEGPFSFSRPERKKTKKGSKVKPRFSSLLTEAEEGEEVVAGEERIQGKVLEELLDDLHGSGERLKDAQTLENIKKYKESVKSFLKYAVDHMLHIEENTSGLTVLKRKRFILIHVIDQKLERLVTEVLRNQLPQLEILNRINEINGLLVNLLR